MLEKFGASMIVGTWIYLLQTCIMAINIADINSNLLSSHKFYFKFHCKVLASNSQFILRHNSPTLLKFNLLAISENNICALLISAGIKIVK